MKFFDTDIISYYFNGNRKIQEKLLEMVDNNENISITVINTYEILKGFKWKNNLKKENQFKEFLEDVFEFSIDGEVIDIASDIYAKLRKNGKTISDADILIAAIVIKNNGILVTNNTMHYNGIEQLRIENWL